MEKHTSSVDAHYQKTGLYEDILARLQRMGIDPNKVTRKDIAGVDEFHVRGAEVSAELAATASLAGARVLDVGCGLGGPCRMLREVYDCHVTGIDLNQEYIRTARKLTELIGLSDCIEFVQGDALALPFEKGSFDVVWTQHVQMNVRDKEKFYAAIKDVLKEKGTFLYYDIFSTGGEEINYPVPWANDASISFLFTTAAFHSLLHEMGFACVQTIDQTAKGIGFFESLFARIQAQGLPALGLHALMGESARVKLDNLLSGLKENKLTLQSGIYCKGG